MKKKWPVLVLMVVLAAVFFVALFWLGADSVDPIAQDNQACASAGIELLNYTERYDGVEILEMREELRVVHQGTVKNCTLRAPLDPRRVVECRVGQRSADKDCFIITVDEGGEGCYIESMENCPHLVEE